MWRAFADWEADLCPGCGQPRTESLLDSTIPEAERRQYAVSYQVCRACHAVEHGQLRIAEQDEAEAKRVKKPVPTGHRHWSAVPQPNPYLDT